MRALALPLALPALLLAACGTEERAVNADRPPSAITVTASVQEGELLVSPREFGAGPVRVTVANQSGAEQAITFQTAGSEAGTTASTRPIRDGGVATLQVAPEEGEYELSVSGDGIDPVPIRVGEARASAQDQLLLP